MTDTNDTAAAQRAAPSVVRGTSLSKRTIALKPLLDAACAEIDAAPEFANGLEATVEARVLRKIVAYRDWLVAHGLPPGTLLARPYAGRILPMIGHPDYEPTEEVKAEIASLSDLVPAGSAWTMPVNPTRARGLICFRS